MFLAQDSGGSPCPSSCPDLNKSQTLSSLSESGAVLVEVCCLLVLAVENKVPLCTTEGFLFFSSLWPHESVDCDLY